MNLQYKLISRFYDLLYSFYFNHIKTNPRKGILDFIPVDIKEYGKKFSLKALNENKCDYTRIIEIVKET